MSKLKASDVYLRAAENFAAGTAYEFSCWEVNHVATNGARWIGYCERKRDFRTAYEELIATRTFDSVKERIIALLFMHQISLDEERGK